MHIVLVHPEIPHNTGCVARTAAATGVALHLVEPLGYSLEDRYLKRAGLDYWPLVDLCVHPDWDFAVAALEATSARPLGERIHLFSSRGGTALFDVPFEADDILVFGREADGLPPTLLARYPQRRVLIPISKQVRSLNLAASVAVATYTALARAGHRFENTAGDHRRDPRMDQDLFAADVARRTGPPAG